MLQKFFFFNWFQKILFIYNKSFKLFFKLYYINFRNIINLDYKDNLKFIKLYYIKSTLLQMTWKTKLFFLI